MKIVILGGKLQGVEASYLARQAGYTSVVIDKNKRVPASGLCDDFCCGDVCDAAFLSDVCADADMVLPALENQDVLRHVCNTAKEEGLPLLHDESAYAISSSKQRSNNLFSQMGIPIPKPWPQCGFPVIVKPSGQSGSKGVQLVESERQMQDLKQTAESIVVQQYLQGPSYSIEVLGDGKRYVALQTTELFMDEQYDCSGVMTPAQIPETVERQLRGEALSIAKKLQIKGIFDVEVILHEGMCKVLEIDARLPSQTPVTVFHSTGVNMLELLCKSKYVPWGFPREKPVLYQQIHVQGKQARVCGEGMMAKFGPLRIRKNFFGAPTAITSWRKGSDEWVAAMIYEADSRDALWEAQRDSIHRIEMR